MKSVFDQSTRDELIQRISSIDQYNTAVWGKMTVSQMLKHCSQWDDMAQGKVIYRQSLIGRLFGKIGLKDMLKDQPMKRNLPTVPSFIIRESADVETEKKKWIQSISRYADYSMIALFIPSLEICRKRIRVTSCINTPTIT